MHKYIATILVTCIPVFCQNDSPKKGKPQLVQAINIRYIDEAYAWMSNTYPGCKVENFIPDFNEMPSVAFELRLKNRSKCLLWFSRLPPPNVSCHLGNFETDGVCSPSIFRNPFACTCKWLKSMDEGQFHEEITSDWVKPDIKTKICIPKSQLINIRDSSGKFISRRLKSIRSSTEKTTSLSSIVFEYISVFNNEYIANEVITMKQINEGEYEILAYKIEGDRSSPKSHD